MAPAVEVAQLHVYYHQRHVLDDVSFSIPAGNMVGIVGPNGAGKSTLLKAMLGLVPRAQGHIRVLGAAIDTQRHLIAYVPQRESVDWDFPIHVRDVVLMGTYGQLKWWQRPQKRQRDQAMDALAQVGMEAFAERHIRELSGGQQQRVFLARALAQQAQLFVLDEPFAGVDVATQQAIVTQLAALRDAGRTILVVHHDLATVSTYFDYTLLLDRTVIACGATAQVFTPEMVQRTYRNSNPFLFTNPFQGTHRAVHSNGYT